MRDRVFLKGEIMVRFATVAAVLALMAAPLVAQESTEQLRKELESIRKEVDGLKAERAQYESKEVAGSAKVGQDSMSPEGDSPIMTALKETKLSGFVDAGYEFSFNHLSTGGHVNNNGTFANANPVRVFDNKGNSFYMNSIQLNLEKLATDKMIVGYHFELAAGHDPLVYDGSNVSLQEGWVQILAPIGTGLDIRVGKFATLLGYEVIESKDDMNYSRGLLFGQAINFTNTGLRMTYNFNDQYWAVLGFNNGPNVLGGNDGTFADTNHGKAVELQFGAKPVKDLLATLTILTGTEDNVSTNDKFYVIDIVLQYTMDKLTLALNFDVDGTEQGPNGPGSHFPKAGVAVYGKFQWTDMMATALRVEYLSDGKGANPALVPSGAGDTGDGAKVVEFTLTQEAKVASHLILRAEFRHDDSNNHVFTRDNKNARGDNSLGFEAIMPF
jgi:hypothetical protein